MSKFIPDLKPVMKNDKVFQNIPNQAFSAEPIVAEDPISISEFKDAIRKFSLNFDEEDRRRFRASSITTKTSAQSRSSSNYWHNLSLFFLISLKETYPEKDFSELEKQMKKMSLDEDFLDNNAFLPYLLGIIDAIL